MRICTGNRIYALRKSRGMTQEQLAAEVGVSAAAVSKWESRNHIPDVDTLCLLADYFGITVDALLGRGDADGSREEQWECAGQTATLLLELSELSRQQGLLAIESALRAKNGVPPFLLFAVHFAMDWILGDKLPTAELEEILNRYADTLAETERTQGRMIVRGLMLIASGEHPGVIREHLASFWGVEFREWFYQKLSGAGGGCDSWESRGEQLIAAWKREHEGKGCYSPATAILEELVAADDLLIQLTLRRITDVDAVCILQGSSYELGCRILNNLSERMVVMLLEESGRYQRTEEELVAGQLRVREAVEDIRKRVLGGQKET